MYEQKKAFHELHQHTFVTFCYGQGTFSTAPVKKLQTDLIFIVTKCR
jgi:hypothetical protein